MIGMGLTIRAQLQQRKAQRSPQFLVLHSVGITQGLNMLHQHAQFEDGSVSVEAGLMAMLARM